MRAAKVERRRQVELAGALAAGPGGTELRAGRGRVHHGGGGSGGGAGGGGGCAGVGRLLEVGEAAGFRAVGGTLGLLVAAEAEGVRPQVERLKGHCDLMCVCVRKKEKKEKKVVVMVMARAVQYRRPKKRGKEK